jgi:hypothetical protein
MEFLNLLKLLTSEGSLDHDVCVSLECAKFGGVSQKVQFVYLCLTHPPPEYRLHKELESEISTSIRSSNKHWKQRQWLNLGSSPFGWKAREELKGERDGNLRGKGRFCTNLECFPQELSDCISVSHYSHQPAHPRDFRTKLERLLWSNLTLTSVGELDKTPES